MSIDDEISLDIRGPHLHDDGTLRLLSGRGSGYVVGIAAPGSDRTVRQLQQLCALLGGVWTARQLGRLCRAVEHARRDP